MNRDKEAGETSSAKSRGMIMRIYLENFVTYDKVVIIPGSNLNVITGPNGTGKSTIVSAIVLGLGGKPSVIGRGNTLSHYVKNGCNNALIEIDLKNTETSNYRIVRRFNLQNENAWTVDGKPVSQKSLMHLMESLHIQVDNLCQLLPQDKVQDFSGMNAQQLLENTQRSVGDPSLIENHTKLKELSNLVKTNSEKTQNRKEFLQSETKKLEGMAEIVGAIKRLKKYKEKITRLRQKRAWMRYDISRKHLCDAKEERDKAAAEVKKLDEKLKPIDEEIRKYEVRIKHLQKNVESYQNELQKKINDADKTVDRLQEKEAEITEEQQKLKQHAESEKNRDREITGFGQQKNKLENDLQVIIEEMGSEEALLKNQDPISKELEKKSGKINDLMHRKFAIEADEREVDFEIGPIAERIKAASDVDSKRLELLKARNHDAYEGLMWLRQHPELFRAPVHEPMLLKIHVKNDRYTRHLETIISQRDLVAFVCEDKCDMNKLMRYLRDEKKLTINVISESPDKNVDRTPIVPIEQLRPFGFENYLVDFIEAPPTIMNYLISQYNIHNIPVGSAMVDKNIAHIPNQIRVFFAANTFYSINTSKYSGEKSTRSSAVTGTGMLSINQDNNRITALRQKLEYMNEKKKNLRSKFKLIDDEIAQLNKDLDSLRSAKRESQKNIQTIQNLKGRITMIENKIRYLQKEIPSMETVKAATSSKIRKILEDQVKLYGKYTSQFADISKFISGHDEWKLELEFLRDMHSTKKCDSEDLRTERHRVEQEFKRLGEEMTTLRNETQKAYDRALASTDGLCPSDALFAPFQSAFAKLPSTVVDIDAAITNAEAEVYCLGDDNAENEHVLRNYEKTEENVRNTTEEIEKLKTEENKIVTEIEKLRPLWLTALEALIHRINKNFSAYFELMECLGEVSLKTPKNPHEYEQYGISIMIRFREDDGLQELTRQRQSGGERAVTTAIYMIALQELSAVPFRCVDEINQGMDSTNERRVFDLIVKITEQSGCQYFLLTPKLLSGLQYGESTTVHCVFNGPYMAPSSVFDIASYLEKHTVS
ncbi:structural maintenance of chromosomes protein 5 [Venturia canescens]|uniref:structural maintenance of chromosomes protein 5 n=1 Tax=Venturia canescens TaxID=32260 RepID=UPI001C9C9959|nr:structural maintenance of chromosomes protein 5 [Venturia canescens]